MQYHVRSSKSLRLATLSGVIIRIRAKYRRDHLRQAVQRKPEKPVGSRLRLSGPLSLWASAFRPYWPGALFSLVRMTALHMLPQREQCARCALCLENFFFVMVFHFLYQTSVSRYSDISRGTIVAQQFLRSNKNPNYFHPYPSSY